MSGVAGGEPPAEPPTDCDCGLPHVSDMVTTKSGFRFEPRTRRAPRDVYLDTIFEAHVAHVNEQSVADGGGT